MDDVSAAKLLISCLDLTSLGENDSQYQIEDLCNRAHTPYGNVAAVCIWPKFISLAKQHLPKGEIKVATVVNFPHGDTDFYQLATDINHALTFGADEIDAVFPYRSFLNQDLQSCEQFLQTVTQLCNDTPTKIILETGELRHASQIAEATKLCLNAGVNFIKTSTGKSPISATPEAANIILETISTAKTKAGFKASGGIKTIEDAKKYLTLAQTIMGNNWVNSQHFRIGASSLLTNLLETIKQGY